MSVWKELPEVAKDATEYAAESANAALRLQERIEAFTSTLNADQAKQWVLLHNVFEEKERFEALQAYCAGLQAAKSCCA